MAETSLRIEIDCDDTAKQQLRECVAPLLAKESDARFVQRHNLDGTVPSWVVILTLGVQVLPPVLTFLAQVISSKRVKRIKVGEVEIENPTEQDLSMMRRRMKL